MNIVNRFLLTLSFILSTFAAHAAAPAPTTAAGFLAQFAAQAEVQAAPKHPYPHAAFALNAALKFMRFTKRPEIEAIAPKKRDASADAEHLIFESVYKHLHKFQATSAHATIAAFNDLLDPSHCDLVNSEAFATVLKGENPLFKHRAEILAQDPSLQSAYDKLDAAKKAVDDAAQAEKKKSEETVMVKDGRAAFFAVYAETHGKQTVHFPCSFNVTHPPFFRFGSLEKED